MLDMSQCHLVYGWLNRWPRVVRISGADMRVSARTCDEILISVYISVRCRRQPTSGLQPMCCPFRFNVHFKHYLEQTQLSLWMLRRIICVYTQESQLLLVVVVIVRKKEK